MNQRQRFSGTFLYHELGSQRVLLSAVRNETSNKQLFDSVWITAGAQFLKLGILQTHQRILFDARLTDQKTFYYPTRFEKKEWLLPPIDKRTKPPVVVARKIAEVPKLIRCPHCNVLMRGIGEERLTHDHIYPRQWNNVIRMFSNADTHNIRICCQNCNGLRGLTGHCIGALACAQQVANSEHVPTRSIILKWKLHQFNVAILQRLLTKRTRM